MALAHNKVKPSYDAVSQVRVELGELPILSQNSAAPIDFLQYMQTQVSRITSPTTIGTALADKPELTALPILSGKVDPEAEIRQTLRVGVVPKTSLIQVEMSSPVPSEAAKIVNAVVDAYLTLARADYDSSTQTKIDHLKPIREEQRQKVEAYRKDVEKLYKSLGTANLDAIKDRNSISLDTCKQISEQLTHVEIMRIATKARLDQLRSEKAGSVVPTDSKQIEQAMADAFYEDPRVVSVQANIEIAEGKLKEAERLNRLRNDPSVVRQHERLNDLKKKKEDLWARLKSQLRSKVTSAPTDADTEHAIKDAESSYEALKTQEDSLKSRLREAKIENNTAEGEALKLEYARMDLQQEVVVFENINNRLTQLQFNAKNPTARVELEYKAKPSIQPNSDRRTQIMIAAPFIMGLFLMSLLVLMELRGGRVSDPDELTSRMRLQVIGVVPPLPQIRSKSAGANGNALSGPPSTQGEFKIQRQLDEYVQSLDHLRVALCAKRDAWGRDRHCVVITSACGSEGKTTLAAQLAERCVNAGMMTLLIDADLRNPTLSRMLDAIENPGSDQRPARRAGGRGRDHGRRRRGRVPHPPGGDAPGRPQPVAPERAARPPAGAGPGELRHDHRRRAAGAAGPRRPDHRPLDRRGGAGRAVRHEPVPAGRAGQPAPGERRGAGDRRGGQRGEVDGVGVRRLLRVRRGLRLVGRFGFGDGDVGLELVSAE